jgi:hypothetical protein
MKQPSIGPAWPVILLAAGLLQACGGGGAGGGGDAQPDAAASGALRAPQRAAADAAPDPLTVFPASSAPGGTIAAFGEGFQGRCGVDLFLDTVSGPPFGQADVTRDGTYSTQLIIPEETASGPHTLLVRARSLAGQACTEVAATTDQEPFTVTARQPVIVVQALEGRPGGGVEVRGRGFCPDAACSQVTILINGQTAAGGVSVNADGTFVANATVPAISAAGPVAVVAVQQDAAGGEARAFGEIIVTVRPNGPRPPPVIP